MKIIYSTNNSGGSFWLSKEDWEKLVKAGWKINLESDIFKCPLAAEKDFDSIEEAIKEFEEITGQDADAEGCQCCGKPHFFYEK